MDIIPVTTSIFQENCFLVAQDGQCIIIDPGDGVERILGEIKKHQLKPLAVMNTHGHVDHIAGVATLVQKFHIPFFMSSQDQYLLDSHETSCRKYNLPYRGTPLIDMDLSGTASVDIHPFSIGITAVPGHTPGGVLLCFGNTVFSGDTIFYRSIGRSDFPGGNYQQLEQSIREKMYSLPDETMLYPGHSRPTTVGEEKYKNPFISVK